MLKKALVFMALLTVGATALFADVNMVGTYWGDASGDWRATISDDQDPIIFRGVWTDGHQDGTLYAEGYIDDDNDHYVFDLGDSYDSDGNLVGHWSAQISIYSDEYSTGPWWSIDNTMSGRWGGYKI